LARQNAFRATTQGVTTRGVAQGATTQTRERARLFRPDFEDIPIIMYDLPRTGIPPSEVLNCFIQKHEAVSIPPLCDAQLQNAAFSVIDAAKSQLSELKLADLFAQQLQGERYTQFISEFLYHWAGVDSKPPDAMIDSCKRQLHGLVREHLASHESPLTEILSPVLPFLTSVSDLDELSFALLRAVPPVSEEPIADTLRIPDGESNAIEQLQAERLREIQRAFQMCLSRGGAVEGDFPMSSQWTGRSVLGSETTPTVQTHDSDGESLPADPGPLLDSINDKTESDVSATDS
jgi:hypothetical protein